MARKRVSFREKSKTVKKPIGETKVATAISPKVVEEPKVVVETKPAAPVLKCPDCGEGRLIHLKASDYKCDYCEHGFSGRF